MLIFLIFFSLNKLGIARVRNTIFLISSPFQKAFWVSGQKVSGFFQTLFELKDLKKENQELKKINFQLLRENLQLQELERENKILREALDLGLEKKFSFILTEPISTETEGDFILINKGKRDGLQREMPVITPEEIILGKIGEVFDDFSQVILISNQGFSFSIAIQAGTENEVLGVSRGKGNYEIQFELVPKEARIEKGNIVSTSLLGGTFPQGLLVGEIKTLKKSDIKPFQVGKIQPYFLETDLGALFVIKEF